METINRRIAACIESLGVKKVEFAKRLKLSPPYISELCSGKTQPSDRTISDICREFNISETWLRTGEGEMFLQLEDDAEFNRICEEIQFSGDAFIKQIIYNYWKLDEKEKAVIRKLISDLPRQ